MPLSHASEIGVDFAIEVEALAAFAGDVGRFLGHVAAEFLLAAFVAGSLHCSVKVELVFVLSGQGEAVYRQMSPLRGSIKGNVL